MTREIRKYTCLDCRLPFKKNVFLDNDGAEHFGVPELCRVCRAIVYARNKLRYYHRREAELMVQRGQRIARSKRTARVLGALASTAIAMLLAACGETHMWHCPPCDVVTDGGALTCPDPTCGDDGGGAITRAQACAQFDLDWQTSVEVSGGMDCGAEPPCPFEGPGSDVDPTQYAACRYELELANDCSFFRDALSSLACNGSLPDGGEESDGGLLDASQLCATGLRRNAELGCGHASGASVDVCPAVWDGTEVCNAQRSATCIERLDAAATCNELVIAWRGDCLAVGVCDPVSP